MDDLYSIPVNSDHKLGLGFFDSEFGNSQFPTTLGELDNEQLLALDDPQSFYLAFSDADVLGSCEETTERGSSAVTPISECSSRTTFSVRNVSPVSEIMPFQDQSSSQDFETMIKDATRSIVSNRNPQRTSASWTQLNNNSPGLNGAPAHLQQFSHRPQSFSYRAPQFAQQDSSTPPPPPSSYFTSPNLSSTQGPFLSPNLQSPLMLPQTTYGSVSGLRPNASSYYGQPQAQPSPMLFQHIHQTSSYQMSLQQPMQAQPQGLQTKVNSSSINNNSSMMHSFFPQQQPQQRQQQQQQQQQLPSQSQFPTASLNPSLNNTGLPHTTGNSATGYQCFSHGCGGRHFSNWGNLVRHHRERQLRSKAGAKPTCPRCGKGFTRSSARDAHVAGLKCVLGRRRRGGGAAAAAAATATNVDAKTKTAGSEDKLQQQDEGQDDHQDSSGEFDAEAEDDEEDEAEIRSTSPGVNVGPDEGAASPGHFDTTRIDFSNGPPYLAPQHLTFEE